MIGNSAAAHSVRHEATARTQRTNRPKCLAQSHPVYRWSVSRRPPLTGVFGCFLLFFKVAFLKQDPDDLATGKLVVPGNNVNGCLDVHEHIAHARPFLSFSVELGEVASHDISLPGRSQL